MVRTKLRPPPSGIGLGAKLLVAALLQGAIFGLVKAAVDRAGAAGFERATGT